MKNEMQKITQNSELWRRRLKEMQEGLWNLLAKEHEDLLCVWRRTEGFVKYEPKMFLPRTSWLSLPSSPQILFLPTTADRWITPAPIATPNIF